MKESWTELSKLNGPQGRDDCQFGWHRWVGEHFHGCAILDVGSGLGLARERLAAGGNEVVLQDPAPGTPVDIHDDIGDLAGRFFDVVTAFDVIEHVLDDGLFLWNLCRIARRSVVITTPNYNVSKAANPFHVREYSPPEFLDLIGGHSIKTLVAGNSNPRHPPQPGDFLVTVQVTLVQSHKSQPRTDPSPGSVPSAVRALPA